MDEAKIINQVRDEYQQGWLYVNTKRIQYRDRIEKRNPQKKDVEKININMISQAIDGLIATSYTDQLTCKFIPRDGFIGQEKADLLNSLFEFDNNEEDYEQLYYQKEQDRYFFGVGIRARVGRDDERKTNTRVSVNPLCVVPDPMPSQTGRFGIKNYRYMGFQMMSSIYDLMSETEPNGAKLYRKEALDRVVANFFSSEGRLNDMTYATAYNYTYPNTVEQLKSNFPVEVYHHFTCVDNKKYIITTTADRNDILRVKEVKAVTKEEKKNSRNIRRPVVLNYWKPRRNDFFGESVCDMLEDKQNAKRILFNLNLITAKKEALGGDFIWNSRLIQNRDDILKPTTTGRNIFVDTNEPLSNAGIEIPRSAIRQDSYQMMNLLDQEGQNAVGMDKMQQGLVPDKTMTKSEAQTIQGNANIKQILNNRINARGDKDFYEECFKGYVENFSDKDEKLIVLHPDFEYRTATITKDIFMMTQDPYIMVATTSEIQAEKEKDKMYWNANLPITLQDQDIPKISKMIARRMALRASGKKPNEINQLCPLMKEETIALQAVDNINAGRIPQSIKNLPPEYMDTLWIYVQKAEENVQKSIVINVLKNIMGKVDEASAGGMQQSGQFGQMANASRNMAQSQMQQGMGPQNMDRGTPLPQGTAP